jgi:hypothetical protein
VSVLLHPYMPSSTERLLGALGAVEVEYGRAAFGGRSRVDRVTTLEPLFPKRT